MSSVVYYRRDGAMHNQDIKSAKRSIGQTAETDVGAVEFQTYKAEKLSSNYALEFFKDDVDLFDLMKENEVVWS